MGFEHRAGILGLWAAARNVAAESDENRSHLQNPLAIMWTERFAVTRHTSNEMVPGEFPGVVSAQRRVDTHACVYV
jgi:hypothetical protein